MDFFKGGQGVFVEETILGNDKCGGINNIEFEDQLALDAFIEKEKNIDWSNSKSIWKWINIDTIFRKTSVSIYKILLFYLINEIELKFKNVWI